MAEKGVEEQVLAMERLRFDNDILKNFIGMLYYQIDIGIW